MAEGAGVSMDEVLRVAELANLELTPDEVPRMQRDLNAILGHIAELNELDTSGVEPMAQVGGVLGAEIGAAFARPARSDGGGAGDGWAVLQGAEGD